MTGRDRNKMAMYTEERLVRIAKRENNNKRGYLVVNACQGKHIPVHPGEALLMFGALAEQMKELRDEKLLIIGFAETATAIGAHLAAELSCPYMHTTREPMEGEESLYFSEEHSHATEQRLIKRELGNILAKVDRVVFAEDEVTTGKTILNAIRAIEEAYGTGRSYSVASLLNGMDEEALKRYDESGISLFYLVKTDHTAYEAMVWSDDKPGSTKDYFEAYRLGTGSLQKKPQGSIVRVQGVPNPRILADGELYRQACNHILSPGNNMDGDKILVLGTEECMYPGLCLARLMEEKGCEVYFHATTRSPIFVSEEEGYPLHCRYRLPSLYDGTRITYLYDLTSYDEVWIVTDAGCRDKEGSMEMAVLEKCLRDAGAKKIHWQIIEA